MGKPIAVSFIIPAVGNVNLTRACIESVREHSALPYEIVLVDNGSDSQELAKLGAEVYLRYEDLLGYPAAINRGIEAASGTYVCLLNNDTEIQTPKWDRILISTLDTFPNAAIVSPVVDIIGNRFQRAEGPGKGIGEATWHLFFVAVLMRRSLFDKVGLLDESFGLGNWEDIEFCRRVKVQGGRLLVNRAVFVRHACHATFSKIMSPTELVILMGRNRERYQDLNFLRRQ